MARGWTLVMHSLPSWTLCFNGAAGVGPRMGFYGGTQYSGALMLQWGRGGWPADIAAEIVTVPADGMLQWGRGGWPADECVLACRGDEVRASMGPRGLARG